MRWLFLFINLSFFQTALTQSGYRAVYGFAGNKKTEVGLDTIYKRYFPYGTTAIHLNFNVAFNDSFAYFFTRGGRKNKINIYGQKPKHHDGFYEKSTFKRTA